MNIEFTPYQLVVPFFSIVMVVYAWQLVWRHKKTTWEGLLWTVFWTGVAYIAFFPTSLQYLSAITGIKKNENAALISAIGILFFAIFYLVIRIEELDQKLIKLVQDRALDDASVPKEDDRRA